MQDNPYAQKRNKVIRIKAPIASRSSSFTALARPIVKKDEVDLDIIRQIASKSQQRLA